MLPSQIKQTTVILGDNQRHRLENVVWGLFFCTSHPRGVYYAASCFDPPAMNPTFPASPPVYVIGDLQGCHTPCMNLLQQIDAAHPGQTPQLWFAGDLVNRGPQSLATLRTIRALGKRARCVLGNHDLHLLAAANGIRALHRSDTLAEILAAPDCGELLDWLRRQPLALLENQHLLVHAGVLPQWRAEQTVQLAAEVEAELSGANWVGFLREMYGNHPARWKNKLTGIDRLRVIVNGLTRLRFCDADGVMDFATKEGAGATPPGLYPWFDVPGRKSVDTTVIFGHWSTLGLVLRENLISLDTGCVWGGKLTAVQLQDRSVIQVNCPQAQVPGA
jgi:bis(5'-nucleosyl)-tetraphosphatase (symmetrical)